jgi:hypothetical protein
MWPKQLPDATSQNDDCDFSSPQILLMTDALVSRQKYFKASRLCGIKQFAVLQPIPPLRSAFLYSMAAQGGRNSSGRAVVEQNAHSETTYGHVEAAGSELKDCLNLLTSDGELLDDFVDGHSMLKILKNNRNRRASALEQPGATHFAGDSLNGRAL